MDLKLDKIDWAQTDEEQIYDIYDNLDLATDKVEMVLHLMENHPIIELGYIEMIEETDERRGNTGFGFLEKPERGL